MKYRKKPALTEATQWFQNGDHPQDRSVEVKRSGGSPTLSEGQVVKHFRRLHIPGGRFCPDCGNVMHKHGLLEGLNGEETVCPGDYVITNLKGQYYVLKPEVFEAQYEPYDAVPTPVPAYDVVKADQ